MKLNGEIIKVINTPEMRERFTLEGDAIGDSPEQFGAYIKTELARWGKVLKEAGIQAE
jgi:tripartite-type tricarboxylate transporter receptor subunit TctC